MKKFFLLLVFTSLISGFLSADLPGQSPKPIGQPSKSPFSQPPSTQNQPAYTPKIPLPPIPKKIEGSVFTLPGIVGIKNNRWVGSDNLYNLPSSISVYVELVAPENMKFDVKENVIKAHVEELFSKNGISPDALHEPGAPSLPLFHVLVLLDSIGEISVASCSCRLFEAVDIKRVILEQGITFQAITWEKQELFVVSKNDLSAQLSKTIDDLSASFVERYRYFQDLKTQKQSPQ